MANAETALKARIAKLKKKADDLGVFYQDDVDEQTLRTAIDEAKQYTSESSNDSPNQAIEIGKVIAHEMGKAMRQVVRDPEEDGLVDERDLDPEDVTEEKSYFTPQFFWIVPAKRIGGQLVKAPYKKMIFKMSQGDATRNGDQWQTRYISVYVTNSKKEQAFLETHPMFNRVFFSNTADANISSDQVIFAQKFSKHVQNLNMRMAPELYRMAAQSGVKVDSKMSLPTLRTNIANVLAQREVEADKARMQSLLTSSGRASLLTQE